MTTIIPQYDEFGIYTTFDEIYSFVESLFEMGFSSEEEILDKCYDEFGKGNSVLIEKVLYGKN